MSLQRELEAYTRLPADWDGYGGQPASRAMLADALAFLAHLPAKAAVPKPMLTGGGAIGLYWEFAGARGARYASVEFDGEGRYTYLTESAADEGGEEDVPVNRCAPGLACFLMAS